ncbi:U3 snoRNP-associated protein-like EMB2271 isoform X1 [Chenopodium quinoa]|uniref:U3 snoRNP-associated protein-like EMB2271 isoform X1 n=1 Tax=Chenopodium quinoa TaxID=63459 RepID=UPI000B77B86E|nr:U3 snoRNP-associated protein-like EMB2271 isoform X1 [Chenopodium quinoa]
MSGRNHKKRPLLSGRRAAATPALAKGRASSFAKQNNSKRRRKFDSSEEENGFDGEIASDMSDGGDDFFEDESNGGVKEKTEEEEKEEELERETVDERRRRLAWELVQKVRKGEEEEREEDEDDDDDDEREERGGIRDSLVAKILQQEQLEDSGRTRRLIASKLQKLEDKEEPEFLFKHRQSVTAVALSDDDRRGFSASKDGGIAHWDVEIRKAEKYLWPSEDVLKSHGVKDPQGQSNKKGKVMKHSKDILALAVSSDGRYLATGGFDRHVHLWDTRTREHIQAFPGHRGPVSCLTFRQGTSEIFSGSFDRTVKIWNAEDRAYITTLFGHQSEVLSIDCMRKERALTVGRDRTMQLYKVPEESRLVYRSSTSALECCCFAGNDEFLSGSDDGSIELWSVLRKKPVSIVKNAHTLSALKKQVELNSNGVMSNGQIDSSEFKASSPCSNAQSWVSSVTVCRNSDLAASGAGDGFVRLWQINSETKAVAPLFDVPLVGYVNSLAIAKSGRFLVAGVGQEPRLGRWDRISTARNGVALQSFKLTS